MRSSRPSSTCRIEWRPSKLRSGALLTMGVLAAGSLQASALPRWIAIVSGMVVLAACALRASREGRQPGAELVWKHGDEDARWLEAHGAQTLSHVTVRWRGPLATLEARDEAGTLRRRSWWPDTLPPAARRALRLASDGPAARRSANHGNAGGVDAGALGAVARLTS